jgi:hypothetical protein
MTDADDAETVIQKSVVLNQAISCRAPDYVDPDDGFPLDFIRKKFKAYLFFYYYCLFITECSGFQNLLYNILRIHSNRLNIYFINPAFQKIS